MSSLFRSFTPATDFTRPLVDSDAFGYNHECPKGISKFEALDDDSIYLIIVALCYTDVTRRLKQIWPLSLTCKRLRDACLPLMFKRVLWPNKRMLYGVDDDVPMLPETLWPYIQNFRCHYSDDNYIDELIDSIPKLTRLSTFSIHTLSTPPDALIDALFHCPSLESLSFEETPLDFYLPHSPSKSIHTLRFKDGRDLRVSGGPQLFIRSWRESPGRKIYERLESERRDSDTAAATRILMAHRLSLQHIELPSGLTCIHDLATLQWPALRVLVLTGPSPVPGSMPILQILQGMAGLRDLRFMYSRQSYLSLCPEPTGTPTPSSTLTLAYSSPNLRSLTLSDPNPSDAVFRGVPPSLESLALPSIYEWPHLTKGIDHNFASQILRDIRGCGVRLRELRMYVDREPTIELLNTIVRYCPTLEILYLGMDFYRRAVRPDVHIQLWEQCADALLPLIALRELYLGLELPESVYIEVYGSVFFSRLPSLEVVGMQQLDISAFYRPARVEWRATYVARGSNGLEYHDICEPLLS